MSIYLKYFELEQSPFEGEAQAKVVLGTQALRDAFATIREGLKEGSARICVNGGPGFGKTSLARSLPKLLGDSARTAIVLNPSARWESLRVAIAKQWGVEAAGLARNRLVEVAQNHRLVLVVDRAQEASEEFLDHLDILLSYRSESDEPVVQSVLLACLSGVDPKQPAPLVWWLDRIQTLQLEFAPIPRDGVASYIHKHLKRAGWRGKHLFSPKAAYAIHSVTGGIPGEISSLCEELLARAAEQNLRAIDPNFVQALIDERDDERNRDDQNPPAKVELAEDESPEEEFEELLLDRELIEVDPADIDAAQKSALAGTAPPSLAESLEHFEQETDDLKEADGDDSEAQEGPASIETEDNDFEPFDPPEDFNELGLDPEDSESLAELELLLNAPSSPEELRALRGGFFKQPLNLLGAAAMAAVVVGVAFALLSGSSDQDALEVATHSSGSQRSMRSNRDQPKRILVKLRGPVTAIQPALPTSSASPSSLTESNLTPPGSVAPIRLDPFGGYLDDEEFAENLTPEDLIDLRPASMRPGVPR